MSSTTTKRPGLQLAIDYGPLLAFFIAFKLAGVFTGTAVFMAAIVVAVILSRTLLGRVSPMLWLSAILVIGFGALTLWFHDERFIKLKPTIIYTGLGLLLLGGLAAGKPLIKYVLEAGGMDELDERGWFLLSRNWGLFFLFMAGLNEILWRNLPTETWLSLKVWALIPLSLLFGAAQIPMLMRHGLGRNQDA